MFSNGDLQWIGTDLESMVFYQSNTCVILLIQEWWINKHNQQVVPVERLKAELVYTMVNSSACLTCRFKHLCSVISQSMPVSLYSSLVKTPSFAAHQSIQSLFLDMSDEEDREKARQEYTMFQEEQITYNCLIIPSFPMFNIEQHRDCDR
ncbi:hypothetical protein FIBSPDRAFT_888000 [Athelia psychrophila]|uniref:Uncharacterized protein n=1 Tax=Athelia psychrophila TaxID=1759441 RepID=A0A166NXM6_9AGAM|nr:hypothetical protein FIBSPDRAFT_888000 [Fibularhizoctonia sp. CBS 109695]